MAVINWKNNRPLVKINLGEVFNMKPAKEKKQALKSNGITKEKHQELDNYLRVLFKGGFWLS